MPRTDDIKRLIESNNRRLQKLQERKAALGLETPISILTEIEDIEAELNRLQSELVEWEKLNKTFGDTERSISYQQRKLAEKSEWFLGRSPQADIHLGAPVVSWQHARIDRLEEGYVLTDLNSANGTFVNGQRIQETYYLKDKDIVQIGPFKLTYDASSFNQHEITRGLRLDAVHLTKKITIRGKTYPLLHDLSISIYPGEFVALVGGSGAGIKTLLKALAGFERPDGDVFVDGENLYQHFDLYSTLIGYVPQDDIVHTDLDVHSTLYYGGQLRLPPDTTRDELEQHIKEALQLVDMQHQHGTIIKQLSGGQRNRVNIAMELLAKPRLLFLDEPTAVFDPGIEKIVMCLLRRLADSGCTVVITTHNIANIHQCDLICFLSMGRLIYFGPPKEAIQFFNVDNFTDIYRLISDGATSDEKAKQWEQHFRQSSYYQQYVLDRHLDRYKEGFLKQPQKTKETGKPPRPRIEILQQFKVLTHRYFTLTMRSPLLLGLGIILPILGLLLMLIADNNWLIGVSKEEIIRQLTPELTDRSVSDVYAIIMQSETFLFILALVVTTWGFLIAAYEIVKESSVYRHERMHSLQLLPYLASKFVVLGVFAAVFVSLFLFVVEIGAKVSLREGFLFPLLETYITLLLGTFAAISIGLFVSVSVRNADKFIIYISVLFTLFQIIFTGVIFELGTIARQLSGLTLTRWMLEGLGVSTNLGYVSTVAHIPLTLDYSQNLTHLIQSWGSLLAFALLFAIGTVIELKRKDTI